MLSDFQKVVKFNSQFGVKLNFLPKFEVFDTEPRDVEFCMKLIREEISELCTAIQKHDYIESIDALADIIYVVLGMSARIGMNMDTLFTKICEVGCNNFVNISNASDFSYSLNDEPLNTSAFRKVVKTFPNTTHTDDVTDILSKTKDYLKQLENAVMQKNYTHTINIVGYILHHSQVFSNNLEKHIFINDNVTYMLNKIKDYLKQLEDAVTQKNYTHTVNILGYIVYYAYLFCSDLGTDMDLAFATVHDNNMSKLCFTEDDAKLTVEYYEQNKDSLGYDSPKYRLSPNNEYWVVYNESTKKILKSIKWKPVDFATLNL